MLAPAFSSASGSCSAPGCASDLCADGGAQRGPQCAKRCVTTTRLKAGVDAPCEQQRSHQVARAREHLRHARQPQPPLAQSAIVAAPAGQHHHPVARRARLGRIGCEVERREHDGVRAARVQRLASRNRVGLRLDALLREQLRLELVGREH